MKLTIAASVLLVLCFASISPAASAQNVRRKSFLDQEHGTVKITNGPIVETLKSDSAVIAWATNLKSNSKVTYGATRSRLDQFEAEPPDGKGLMHRVQLANLEPGRTYFFRVESSNHDSGKRDSSKVLSFTTPAEGAQAIHNEVPR